MLPFDHHCHMLTQHRIKHEPNHPRQKPRKVVRPCYVQVWLITSYVFAMKVLTVINCNIELLTCLSPAPDPQPPTCLSPAPGPRPPTSASRLRHTHGHPPASRLRTLCAPLEPLPGGSVVCSEAAAVLCHVLAYHPLYPVQLQLTHYLHLHLPPFFFFVIILCNAGPSAGSRESLPKNTIQTTQGRSLRR